MRKRGTVLLFVTVFVLAVILTGCDVINQFTAAVVEKAMQTASASPVSSADLQGSISGQTYSNPAAGFSITYPDSYKLLDNDQLKTYFSDSSSNPKETRSAALEDTPVSYALKVSDGQADSSFNIVLSKYSGKTDIVSLGNQFKISASLSNSNVQFKDVVKTTVGGKDAGSLESTSEVNGITVYMKHYFLLNNGYFVVITYGGASQDQQDLNQAIGTVHFFEAGYAPAVSIDPKGSIIGQTYTNPTAGFTITYPNGFNVLTMDQFKSKYNDEFNSIAQGTASGQNVQTNAFTASPISLAFLENTGKPAALFVVEIKDTKTANPGDILDYVKFQKKLLTSDKTASDPVALKVDGKDAALMKVVEKDQNTVRYDDLYCLYNKNYLILVMYTYMQEQYAQYGMDGVGTIVLSS